VTVEIDTPQTETTRPPIRAIPGRRRYRVTIIKPAQDIVHRHLSEPMADQMVKAMTGVMYKQKADETDLILGVKIEPEF
jgi:hypothetical protein